MSKILFISDNLLNEGLGIMYISSYIKANGHECELLLLSEFNNMDDLVKMVEISKPDLVGFSVMTPQVEQFRAVSRIIKERTELKIIWGGAHCMFMADDVMSYGCVDIICTGEGEEPVLELLNKIANNENYSNVKSMYVKIEEKWYINPLGELSDDLDKYPFPDRELYYDKYPLLANFAVKRFITSRGCPYKCSYCFEPSFFNLYKGKGKVVRRHSPDYVVAEIKRLIEKYPTIHIHFGDDIFNLNRKWITEFTEKYKAKINMPFTCNIELTSLDEEIIMLLKQGGCKGGVFGLETGVESTRINILNKKITNARYTEVTRLLRKHDFQFMMNIMFCLPNETLDDAIESLKFAQSLKSNGLRISILKMYKGTELAKYAASNGLSEGVGEFTYKALDKHQDFKKIENVQWAAVMFTKFPYTFKYAKIILKQEWANIFKPLQVFNHWDDIKFFNIPVWQAFQYFWASREVFIGGMAQAQKDTYLTGSGDIRPVSDLFVKPKGVIDWTGDREFNKEKYFPLKGMEKTEYSTMQSDIYDSLKNIMHPIIENKSIVDTENVRISDPLDGHVSIEILLDEHKIELRGLSDIIKNNVDSIEGIVSSTIKYSYKPIQMVKM